MSWMMAGAIMGGVLLFWVGLFYLLWRMIHTAPLMCGHCGRACPAGTHCALMTRSASCAAQQGHSAQSLEVWRTYIEQLDER